jgi:hypothetical protein
LWLRLLWLLRLLLLLLLLRLLRLLPLLLLLLLLVSYTAVKVSHVPVEAKKVGKGHEAEEREDYGGGDDEAADEVAPHASQRQSLHKHLAAVDPEAVQPARHQRHHDQPQPDGL